MGRRGGFRAVAVKCPHLLGSQGTGGWGGWGPGCRGGGFRGDGAKVTDMQNYVGGRGGGGKGRQAGIRLVRWG